MNIRGIFHVKIAIKWTKSHDSFPLQPGLQVTVFIPNFDFLYLKTYLVQISETLKLSISTYIRNS